MTKKRDYFLLKEVKINKANELVQFETKFSGEAKRVIGYFLSATKSNDKLALATVGISFNGGRENTINQDLIVRNPVNIRRRTQPLCQNQIILQNSYVKGFIEDKGVAAVPYTVKIYFHLSRN